MKYLAKAYAGILNISPEKSAERNWHLKNSPISKNIIDDGINQIINRFNKGQKMEVYFPSYNTPDVLFKVFPPEDKDTYDIPSFNQNFFENSILNNIFYDLIT